MKPHRAGLLFASGSALALLLAACGGSSNSASPQPTSTASQVFTYDTTATVMDDGWDPATEYSNAIIAMNNMYETLTRYNSVTHKTDPMLATSWSKSADGLTWTFHLRHGVHFHTGRLMTAQAAKAALQRTIKLGGGAAYVFTPVKSMSTPNQYTLVFHLSYPAPIDVATSAAYSAYIYDTQAAGSTASSSALTKWFNTPHDAGTGPYTVQTWNKGQEFEVILKAYPGYWGGWSGPHYKKLVFRVVSQDSTSAQLLRSGQVSFVEQVSPSVWQSFKGNQGIRTVSAPSWQNLLAQINSKTLSLNLRQAISYGIDYPGIIAALHGAAVPSSGIIPDGLFGHSTNLPNYSYDPAKATQMLKQAGYGPGGKALNLSLTYTQGDSNEQVVATLLKSSLARLNINLSTQSLAWPTQWAKAKSSNEANRQSIFLEYWWPDMPDPSTWFTNLLLTEHPPYYNISYYSNPSLDKQINKVDELTATNPAAGSQLYHAMQVEILQQAPLQALYNVNYQYAMRTSFTGFVANPAYANVVFVYNLKPTG
jgi:peptide/nickel transport system substrate-binding protein